MKKLLVCAAALGLFVAAPALSAPQGNQHGDKNQGSTQGTKSHDSSGGTHHNAPTGPVTGRTHTRTGSAHQNTTTTTAVGSKYLPASGDTTARTVTGVTHTQTRGAMSGNSFTANGPSNTSTRSNAMNRNNSQLGSSGWSGSTGSVHPSINSLRLDVQAPRHFHNGNYNAPQGYQVRHWTHGDRLPRGYYGRDYWIIDFLAFGLFAPPPDLIWVRVGDDALLIDRYSGDIVQVDYGVFY